MIIDKVLPSQEQLLAIQNYPKGEPVVMVNIIKFKEKTEDGTESGLMAYQRYSKLVYPLLQKAGGRLLWSGQVAQTLIGDPTDQPNQIFMVEYPSTDHFLGMISSAEYQAIAKNRTIALEYGGLIACRSSDKLV